MSPAQSQLAANNLYLSGFMGAGKSTVGPLLAQQLGWSFVDLDCLIEAKVGMKASLVFKEKGEAYFRSIESEVLKEVSKGYHQVVSLGGGTLLADENRKLIADSGINVYLRADVHTLVDRIILAPGTRPLMVTSVDEPLVVRVRVLMKARKPFYEEAGLIIDTDGKLPIQTVRDILFLL